MRRFFKKFFPSCALNIFAGIFVGLETLKTRISENQSPEIKIYLLNPNSAYLEKRAGEKWNQKPTKKNGYINSHKTNIGNFIRDFGEQRIFLQFSAYFSTHTFLRLYLCVQLFIKSLWNRNHTKRV